MIPNAAPVAYFVYRRVDHVRKSLAALAANDGASETDLLIYSDGPRTKADEKDVAEVRELVSALSGFRSVTLVRRSENWGLARSFIGGVSETLQQYDRVIVLEDDNFTSPYFLKFMNDALAEYAEDDRVVSVSGYVYPTREPLPESFFIRGADSWGWATWRRGWAHFNPDGRQLLQEIYRRGVVSELDFNDSFCFSCMLEAQVAGLNDSWAVRWYASAFLKDKLTLYPGRSLVHNIGNDASGTHGSTSEDFDVALATGPVTVGGIPVAESALARRAFENLFRDVSGRPNRAMTMFRRVATPGQVVFLRKAVRWAKRLRQRLSPIRRTGGRRV